MRSEVVRRFLILAVGVFFLASVFPLNTYAWDTVVKVKGVSSDWRSIYEATAYNQGGKITIRGNEHAELSAMALTAIGAGKLLVETKDAHLVVDINASYFHRNLSDETYVPADAPDDGLERRILPPPAQFAGVPDFSYSIYDWINKNALCPAVPPEGDAVDQCHAFSGWMGAGLNASHFGMQAELNYKHLHKLALSIADLTRSIRVKLEKKPEVLNAYRDFVREGEWMALAYEGFASHFLADRWSTGHMWERWNAGDYDHLASKKLFPNKVIGIISGLIHGWEPVLHGRVLVAGRGVAHNLFPAPLSAPWIESEGKRNRFTRAWRWWAKGEAPQFSLTKIKPSLWKHESGDRLMPGVGDDILADMNDGQFGKRYGFTNSMNLNVPTQRTEMMACVEAGWADTIRALGKNKQGSYGIENIALNNDAPSLNNLKHNCFNQFVTNQSIARAWPFTQPTFWSKLGHTILTVSTNSYVQKALTFTFPLATRLIGKERIRKTNQVGKILVRISARIWAANKQHALGIELATGGLKEINVKPRPMTQDANSIEFYEPKKYGAAPGFEYGAANYLPPEDISTLPDKDSKAWRARDMETIYGFFSKAGAHHWCGMLPELLPKLRESNKTQDQAVCRYLGDLAYQGTDPDYTGRQSEMRTATNKAEDAPIPSYCQAVGITRHDSSFPAHLLPGYVEKPYRRTSHDLTYASVGAWCAMVPVFNYIRDESGAMKDETVAKIKNREDAITLTGKDLGIHKGKLWIDCKQSGGLRVPNDKIKSWDTSAIIFDLTWLPEEKQKEESFDICVETEEGKKSVGYFMVVLDIANIDILGKITSDKGDSISGAVATLELGDKKYTGSSGTDGKYHIEIPENVIIPDAVFVMADKKGYSAATRTLNKKQFGQADFTLSKTSKFIVEIEKGLHHLGNGQFGGSINSQFQHSSAEATRFEKSFELNEEQLPPNIVGAKLLLSVKGAEENNPVAINGKNIGVVNSSNGDGSASVTALDFDVCTIKSGSNSFVIASTDSNANSDIDDFEFTNVQLHLTPVKELSKLGEKQLAKLSSLTATVRNFTQPLSRVNIDGRFWIKAKGKSRCTDTKGIARAGVYLKGASESDRNVIMLMETAPGSSEFRSTKAVSVKELGAIAGQTIVIKAGMRGVNIIVNDPNAAKIKALKEKLNIVKAAKNELDDLRWQWKRLSDYINEQHSAGKGVADLMRNLRPITARIQVARTRYVELKNKHGTIKSLQTEIKKLDPSYMPQASTVKPSKPKSASTNAPKPQGKQKPPSSSAQGGTTTSPPSGGNATPSPSKAKPKVKQVPIKPERWDAYKLKVVPRGSGLPNIDVVKIAFNKTATRTQMRIRQYPVSLLRDEKTGVILWKVNWSGDEIMDQASANDETGMAALTAKAHQLRQGAVNRAAITKLIKQQLGNNARPLQ